MGMGNRETTNSHLIQLIQPKESMRQN